MRIFDVAFLGTSLTNGSGTGWVNETRVHGGMWQPFVANSLVSGMSDEFLYYNFGLSGNTSTDAMPFIYDWAQLRPKMMIFEYGMNDAATERNVTLAEARSNAEAIIDMFQTANPDIKIGLMTTNKVLSWRVDDRPNLSGYYQQYRDIVAERDDLFLVDNEPYFADATPVEIPDGIHPLLPALRERLVPMLADIIRPYMDQP